MVIDIIERLVTKEVAPKKTLVDYSRYNGQYYWWFSDYEFYIWLRRVKRENRLYRPRLLRFRKSMVFFVLESFLLFFKYLLLRVIVGWRDLGKKRHGHGVKTISISHQNSWKYIRLYRQKKIVKGDFIYEDLFQAMEDEFSPLVMYTFSVYPRVQLQRDLERLFYWKTRFVPLEIYYSPRVFLRTLQARRFFIKAWKQLEHEPKFIELIDHVSLGNRDSWFDVFRFYFFRVYPRIVLLQEVFNNVLVQEDVKAVLLKNEYGTLERSLLFQSAKQRIPVLALQHGEITKESKGYIYPKVLREKIILPGVTALQGEFYAELLLKYSVFTSTDIQVTGQPRYDMLAFIDRVYSIERSKQRLGITGNKRVIVWTTQTHGIPDHENKLNVEALKLLLQRRKDVVLIIKQHHGERKEHHAFYVEAFKEYRNVKILRGAEDTFELMWISDLVITKHSTTGLEAVALGKPLLIMNLSGEPDIVNYVKEGVAVGAYSVAEVAERIDQILTEGFSNNTVREIYIRKYLYKLDGKAGLRVIQLLRSMIEGKKEKNI